MATVKRTLTGHQVNGVNDGLNIIVMDLPGPGGANHRYDVVYTDKDGSECRQTVQFQNGPIKEAGVNGTTHEALLEIVADRLRSFQAGPYKSNENRQALSYLEMASAWLKDRTRRRLAAGIEGTMAKDGETAPAAAPAPAATAPAAEAQPETKAPEPQPAPATEPAPTPASESIPTVDPTI